MWTIQCFSGDISNLKKSPFVMKEGAKYKIKIYFYCQREIVTGLKFHQTSYRKGIKGQLTIYNGVILVFLPKMFPKIERCTI